MNIRELTGQDDTHITYIYNNIGVHHDMLSAWNSLKSAALKINLDIKIASGFRDFSRQLNIWNNKFSGQAAVKNSDNVSINMSGLNDWEKAEKILLYSALPGASRHHWGSDIDVYCPKLLPEKSTLQLEMWEYCEGGPFAQLTEWLNGNAHSYGFNFPYNSYRGGVAAEPWHLSYQPIAKEMIEQCTPNVIYQLLANSDILGKEALLKNLDIIFERYILNINTTINNGIKNG